MGVSAERTVPLTPSFFAALSPHSVILNVGCRSEESLTTARRTAQVPGDAKLTNWLSVKPGRTQVLPFRIHRPDKVELLLAEPALNLRFAIDRICSAVELLEIHKPRYAIPAGEAGCLSMLVLVYTADEVIGYARVKCGRLTGHDVNVERSWLST